MKRPHFVYRCFDADGALLYIGCTADVRRRFTSHRAGRSKASRWLTRCMDRYEVTAYPDCESALAAEAAAINAEQPIFNYQHRANTTQSAGMTRSAVARYLIDHGHLELALATACGCWRESREAARFDEWCVPHSEAARAAA